MGVQSWGGGGMWGGFWWFSCGMAQCTVLLVFGGSLLVSGDFGVWGEDWALDFNSMEF